MGIRQDFDIKAYLILGPENCGDRSVEDIVSQAVKAGFTFVQVRSKVCGAREMIECAKQAADAIAALGKSDSVALVINDRLDVALACRDMGIKVDGIHVGQSDIPVEICRKYLGDEAIVGLSAETREVIDYVKNADVSCIDYFGVGPLHDTESKKDLVRNDEGEVVLHTIADLEELARISPIPVVVGGGVKAEDVPTVAATGLHGFFVISAVCGAVDPYAAAKEMVDAWA